MSGFSGQAGILERLHEAQPGDTLLVREGEQDPRRYQVVEIIGDRARVLVLRGVKGAERRLMDCRDHAVLVRKSGDGSECRRVTGLEIVHRLQLPVADLAGRVDVDSEIPRPVPISTDELAWLLRCETVKDLAEWILDNGEGIDIVTAMRVLLLARKLTNAKP